MNRDLRERARYARQQKHVALGMVIFSIVCLLILLALGNPNV